MLAYSPKADGRADPGEVVWALVAYEDQSDVAKDRPLLVVGRKDPWTVLALMLSSQPKRDGASDWLALGEGTWDARSRPSWVRLDRVLELSDRGIRREGAVLDRERFSRVAQALRDGYQWQYPTRT
jgi:hypothetical protein